MTMLGWVSRTHRRMESSLVRSISGKSTQATWAIGASVRRSSQPTWPIFPMSRMRGSSIACGSCKKLRRRHITQAQAIGVPLGKQRFLQWPFDADVRVVPADGQLVLRRVKLGAFVLEERGLAEHGKPVRKSGRDIELPLVLPREHEAVPFPESGRATPNVHRHVEHLALQHLEQFALRCRILKMEPPQNAAARERNVVLHEVLGDAGLAVAAQVPRLEEEAARIAKHLGLKDEQAGDIASQNIHQVLSRKPLRLRDHL